MATPIYLKTGGAIQSIVNIPMHNLLAFISQDEVIRITPNYSCGSVEARGFEEHESPVVRHGVVRISEHILCSLDASGKIFSWSVLSLNARDSFQLRDTSKKLDEEGVLLKVNETRLIVADGSERITILSHLEGQDLEIRGGFKVLHAPEDTVYHMAFHNGTLVVMGRKGSLAVWDYATRKLLQQISMPSVGLIALNDKFIVASYNPSGLRFFKNGDDYTEVVRIDFESSTINGLTFVSDKYLTATTFDGAYFICLKTGKVKSQAKFESKANGSLGTFCGTLLHDNRIAIGGSRGIATVLAPNECTEENDVSEEAVPGSRPKKRSRTKYEEEDNPEASTVTSELAALKDKISKETESKTEDMEKMQAEHNASQKKLQEKSQELRKTIEKILEAQKVAGEKMKCLEGEVRALKDVISQRGENERTTTF